ncbi:MAG: DUF502 domain-containing protein [Hylemonella sp.]|uniref:DUF502 domain-containing protein n=1 Tax=Hylemonella sp. TaxID=2066020 RepID=UPI0022C5F069|nr:DUF502 domain-containing protein [Hylemonella sp.]MCZ8253169.1 DUF502 domain-containing protein [Hylemonella sp.]
MKLQFRHPLRTLFTGLLAMLPLAATLMLIGWALSLLSTWLGPQSSFGRVLVHLGLGGTGSELLGYALGLLLLLACIYLLGLLTEAGLERGLARAVHALVQRIPVVRTVYDVIQKLVDLFSQSQAPGLKSMSPVWLHFGGRSEAPGTAVLGLLSTPEPVLLGGQPYFGVLVPTAPVPVGGGLLFVPAAWVEAADIGVEAVTSIYVSMGVTAGQYLPTQR